jgi:hypothetical protein
MVSFFAICGGAFFLGGVIPLPGYRFSECVTQTGDDHAI